MTWLRAGVARATVVALCMTCWAGVAPVLAGASGVWLGLTVQPLTPEIAASLGLRRTRGALVSDVDANGPAARAGLRPGDVIIAAGGHPIWNENDLRDQINDRAPGTTLTLVLWHDGRRETLSPQLAELPAKDDAAEQIPAWSPSARWGFSVEPRTSVMAEVLAVPGSSKGVVVTAVDPHGAGAASGLETIDVIEQVDGRPVGSAAELRVALQRAVGRPALLFIDRNGLTMFLTMRTDQP